MLPLNNALFQKEPNMSVVKLLLAVSDDLWSGRSMQIICFSLSDHSLAANSSTFVMN